MLSKKILLCNENEDSNIRGGSRIKKNKVGENWGSSFLAFLQEMSILISISSSIFVWHSSRLKIIKPNNNPSRINKEDSGSFEDMIFDLLKIIFAIPQTKIKVIIAKKIFTSSHLQSIKNIVPSSISPPFCFFFCPNYYQIENSDLSDYSYQTDSNIRQTSFIVFSTIQYNMVQQVLFVKYRFR